MESVSDAGSSTIHALSAPQHRVNIRRRRRPRPIPVRVGITGLTVVGITEILFNICESRVSDIDCSDIYYALNNNTCLECCEHLATEPPFELYTVANIIDIVEGWLCGSGRN